MELKIVRPLSLETMEIHWLEAHTEQGNYVIMPGHAPMVLILTPHKEVSYERADNTRTEMTLKEGLLEVTRTSLTLVITDE
jgi:F0F1-type ATP synthase epsilon subunit